jgi:hypothetical protein
MVPYSATEHCQQHTPYTHTHQTCLHDFQCPHQGRVPWLLGEAGFFQPYPLAQDTYLVVQSTTTTTISVTGLAVTGLAVTGLAVTGLAATGLAVTGLAARADSYCLWVKGKRVTDWVSRV